jgi:hypothetical protein
VAVRFDIVPVKAVEPFTCTEPHEAAAAVQNTVDSIAGESIFNSHVLEYAILTMKKWNLN